jgi:hypothetical protein
MATVRHLGLFPWCFDPQEGYFKEADLIEKAVPMWWRVKKWKYEIALTIRTNSSPIYQDVYILNSFADVEEQIPQDIFGTGFGNFGIKNELDLVCVDRFGFNVPGEHAWKLESEAIAPGGLTPSITGFGDSYFSIGPRFTIFIDQDDLIGAGSSVNSYMDGQIIGSGPQIGVITIKFINWTHQVPMYAQFPEYLGSLYDLLEISGTLEPEEYWPYDPNDGLGPIYDKTTGSALRGFS